MNKKTSMSPSRAVRFFQEETTPEDSLIGYIMQAQLFNSNMEHR